MRWFVKLVIALLTDWWWPKPRVDRSIVGKSRMDEQGERIEVVCAAAALAAFIAYEIARAKGWL